MNKELTPSEALERIIGCSTIESHTQKWQEDYDVVEKSLKALELTRKFIWLENNEIYVGRYGDIEIKLTKDELTQEEYDLLKEVLL